VSAGGARPPKVEFPRLNAIVDVDAARRAGWTALDLGKAFLDGGARFLQLRAKSMAGRDLLETASALASVAHRYDAILIVNDRPDIARLSGADGVHVGQDDLAPAAVRRVVGADAIVGLSTHTAAELNDAVRQMLSYVATGPVFATPTKVSGYDPIGLAGVAHAAVSARTADRPLVAIGGITLENARSVIESGASSVAVISDLLSSGDPQRRTRDFLDRLEG
jgi:thiamine-phosphate pyrophosphorylase